MKLWKRKTETTTTTGGGRKDKMAELGLGFPAWLLSTSGFGILLGGIAAMQKSCGSTTAIQTMGSVSYLAPVSCDRFFSFDWFIVFWHFFTWLLVAIFMFSRKVHLSRAMITSFLAVAATLLMFTANTWYRVNGVSPPPGIPGLSGTFKARARVAMAGAIVATVADLLLIMILGVEYEKEEREEEPVTVPTAGYRAATTTTAAAPETTAAPVETTATAV